MDPHDSADLDLGLWAEFKIDALRAISIFWSMDPHDSADLDLGLWVEFKEFELGRWNTYVDSNTYL